MVLRFVALVLVLAGCEQPNLTGLRGLRDAASDEGGADAPADVAPGDTTAPADLAAPAPDGPPTECMPGALGCSADGLSVRTCSKQGTWTVTSTCAAQTTCSGGTCLCAPEVCDEGSIHTIAPTPGLVGDLAGGTGSIYVAVNGPQASIRQIVLQNDAESVVQMGTAPIAVYSLDTDAAGTLIWCSDVPGQGGELTYGTTRLDTGSCTHVRRRDDVVYYKSDFLYRKGLAGSPRVMVTREPMDTFELAGDFVYLIGHEGENSFLKRLSLADPGRVDTIASRSDWLLRRLMVDPTHAYVMTEDAILRVAQGATAQPDTFWRDASAQPWALAQTDSHVYWSTTTVGGTGCLRAQVWRRPKQGGPEAIVSTVQGRCAGELLVLGSYLYATIGGPPGVAPTDILRIRL
jgi:hypothetical protein